MSPNRPKRRPNPSRLHDHLYNPNGTLNLFTSFEPFGSHRVVLTRDRRTKVDWAVYVRTVLDEYYSESSEVVLVKNNLKAQGLSSLYEGYRLNK